MGALVPARAGDLTTRQAGIFCHVIGGRSDIGLLRGMNPFSASRALFVCSTFFAMTAQAQLVMPSTTHVGINELVALAQKHPDAKELTERTQGYYPTALVHGRCMVGFLGKVNTAFDPSAVDDAAIAIGSRKGDIISFLSLIHI